MAEQIRQLSEEEKKKANKGCLTILFVIGGALLIWYLVKPRKIDDTKSDSEQYQSSSSNSTTTTENSNGSSSSNISDKDPYEVMHIAFEGFPDKEKMQPMIEAIMTRYNMPITNDNILKVGNMLVVLRKESKVGVTEIEILKHIYQKGSSGITLGEQAGISATILETTK